MKPKKLSNEVPIRGLVHTTVGDFWSWAYSDILSNANRGVFAEFLVAHALGITDTPRIEWDAVDLRYQDKKIEIKASAYCQTWPQKAPPRIAFDIEKKRPWDAASNVSGDKAIRSSDCYVFCLFAEKDRDLASSKVIDVDSWEFYVVSTAEIDRVFGDQKRVALSRISKLAAPVDFGDLKRAIDENLNNL